MSKETHPVAIPYKTVKRLEEQLADVWNGDAIVLYEVPKEIWKHSLKDRPVLHALQKAPDWECTVRAPSEGDLLKTKRNALAEQIWKAAAKVAIERGGKRHSFLALGIRDSAATTFYCKFQVDNDAAHEALRTTDGELKAAAAELRKSSERDAKRLDGLSKSLKVTYGKNKAEFVERLTKHIVYSVPRIQEITLRHVRSDKRSASIWGETNLERLVTQKSDPFEFSVCPDCKSKRKPLTNQDIVKELADSIYDAACHQAFAVVPESVVEFIVCFYDGLGRSTGSMLFAVDTRDAPGEAKKTKKPRARKTGELR